MSVLGLDSGYTVKYNPLPSGVPSGFALGNSFRPRVIFDRVSFVLSLYGYNISKFSGDILMKRKTELVGVVVQKEAFKYRRWGAGGSGGRQSLLFQFLDMLILFFVF